MSLVVLGLRIQRFHAKPEIGVFRHLSIEDSWHVLIGQEVLLGKRHVGYVKLLFLVEYEGCVWQCRERGTKYSKSLMTRVALRGYDSRNKKPMLRFAEPSGEVSFLGRETFGSGHKWPLSRDSAVGAVSGTLSALLPCEMSGTFF